MRCQSKYALDWKSVSKRALCWEKGGKREIWPKITFFLIKFADIEIELHSFTTEAPEDTKRKLKGRESNQKNLDKSNPLQKRFSSSEMLSLKCSHTFIRLRNRIPCTTIASSVSSMYAARSMKRLAMGAKWTEDVAVVVVVVSSPSSLLPPSYQTKKLNQIRVQMQMPCSWFCGRHTNAMVKRNANSTMKTTKKQPATHSDTFGGWMVSGAAKSRMNVPKINMALRMPAHTLCSRFSWKRHYSHAHRSL